jgi:hypothetical protein
MARWKRPWAAPWLVIVDGRWGDGFRDPGFLNGAVALPG